MNSKINSWIVKMNRFYKLTPEAYSNGSDDGEEEH